VQRATALLVVLTLQHPGGLLSLFPTEWYLRDSTFLLHFFFFLAPLRVRKSSRLLPSLRFQRVSVAEQGGGETTAPS